MYFSKKCSKSEVIDYATIIIANKLIRARSVSQIDDNKSKQIILNFNIHAVHLIDVSDKVHKFETKDSSLCK